MFPLKTKLKLKRRNLLRMLLMNYHLQNLILLNSKSSSLIHLIKRRVWKDSGKILIL